MNVEIVTVATQFLFWEYLIRIFGIGSLQCVSTTSLEWTTPFLTQFFLLRSLESIPSPRECLRFWPPLDYKTCVPFEPPNVVL
jgi:hypothetical protein